MSAFLPTPQQLDFLDWEMGAFFHFGIRTFYEGHRDWDGKPMPLEGFNPTELDCERWIRAIAQAGMKYAILVCKHHDGFANWPSKYTEYGVQNTPWRGGKGDVVRDFVDACRKYDIKVGLYYSPAEVGYTQRTAREHDDYFIAQVGELLENYGKIDYLWFDGCGSEGHEYDKKRIVQAIRQRQSEILLFNMWDPDTRWIGNESGVADVSNSNLVTELDFSVLTEEQERLGGEHFLPAECDFMMRDRNWFYSEYDVHTVKSVGELIGLYEHSVGNGANFLVNIGPDRRGLLPDTDANRLMEFGAAIRARYASPLTAEAAREGDIVSLRFPNETLVDHLVLSEDLTNGEQITAFRVLIKNRTMHAPAVVHIGSAVGHKRIVGFPCIRAAEVRVEITGSRGEYHLNQPEAFRIG